MKTTAEVLSDYKAATGSTDQQIADAVGVKQPSVSEWVSGRAVPTDKNLPKLAALLRMDLDELAIVASYSRRIRAKNVDQIIGVVSQLEAVVLRLERRIQELEKRGDGRARKAR